MLNNYIKLLSLSALLFKFFCFSASAEIINGIDIKGNERIADETILMFSKTNLNDDIDEDSLNKILKNLYNTNFFENVSVSLKNNILTIVVKENPIIENTAFFLLSPGSLFTGNNFESSLTFLKVSLNTPRQFSITGTGRF